MDPTRERAAGEELLQVWLRLSSTLWNTRMVQSMTFHEAHACGLLAAAEARGKGVCATELCESMQVLKSQMNRILKSLEQKGYIERERSASDRRTVELRLTAEGKRAYEEEHEGIMKTVLEVVAALGVEQSLKIAQGVDQVVGILSGTLTKQQDGKA